MARRQIATFFVLAFALTWGYHLFLYTFVTKTVGIIPPWTAPGAWGPLVAAIVVTWLAGGDLRAWASQLLEWRIHPGWFLLALAIPIAADEFASVVAAGLGYEITFFARPAWMYVAHFLLVLLFAGALEEFGWRGFAQPRLQARYSAGTAALVVGVLWACWHLPLFVLFDATAYDPTAFLFRYLPWVVALSVILAWTFNATGGSILPAMVLHAANNGAGLLQIQGELPGLLGLFGAYSATGVYWTVALALMFVYGTSYLAPRRPDPAIPGWPSGWSSEPPSDG